MLKTGSCSYPEPVLKHTVILFAVGDAVRRLQVRFELVDCVGFLWPLQLPPTVQRRAHDAILDTVKLTAG